MSDHSVAESASADLSQYDELWTKTAAAPREEPYNDIPDGAYDVAIEDVVLTETTSTGRPVVIWTLRIEGPQCINRVLSRNRVITDKTIAWLKEDLEKCGLSLPRLSELGARLGEIRGRIVPIEKRTKAGRVNFYFCWQKRKPVDLADDDLPF